MLRARLFCFLFFQCPKLPALDEAGKEVSPEIAE